ncbi:Bug family tripartite tricarboxylate transporter substrate binding protein [Ancylobacter terrae]|uniref:Bug family tripartite tricarboxylate transporter substrate binding protein n=1 Tax=Ancylobacter sp. sgz301288 TaxID=3342077 RepID=UPI00385C2937
MLCFAAPTLAQTKYPEKTVKIIVPSPPGGGIDITARVLSEKLSKKMGQQFVVENRPGAGNMIGISTVARAPNDGYTLLVAATPLVLNGLIYKDVAYDPQRDFAPVSLAASLPNVLLVNPKFPARTMQEFVAEAKKKPGQLDYGSAGIGTSPHMSMELLKSMAGVEIEHVPYKGTSAAITDLLGGRISATMANVLTAAPFIKSGELIPLGVTSTTRVPSLPDVPTIAEAGLPGYEALQWYGLLAPAGTPPDVVNALQAEVSAALQEPDVRERFAADGAVPVGSTPAAFSEVIKADLAKWTKVAQDAGIKPE